MTHLILVALLFVLSVNGSPALGQDINLSDYPLESQEAYKAYAEATPADLAQLDGKSFDCVVNSFVGYYHRSIHKDVAFSNFKYEDGIVTQFSLMGNTFTPAPSNEGNNAIYLVHDDIDRTYGIRENDKFVFLATGFRKGFDNHISPDMIETNPEALNLTLWYIRACKK